MAWPAATGAGANQRLEISPIDPIDVLSTGQWMRDVNLDRGIIADVLSRIIADCL